MLKSSNSQIFKFSNLQIKTIMFKHYFEGIKGIANYPIFSLIVFITFFVLVTFWVIKSSKGYIHHMEHLPLDDNKD